MEQRHYNYRTTRSIVEQGEQNGDGDEEEDAYLDIVHPSTSNAAGEI